MSNRLDKEREEKLQPIRFKYALEVLTEMGYEVKELGKTTLQFKHKNEAVTFYPYSGWHSGKSIKDGRGLKNLIDQLKQ